MNNNSIKYLNEYYLKKLMDNDVNVIFEQSNGDVCVRTTWCEPITPESVANEVAKEIVRSNENKLIQRVYELPYHYIINDGATILFWKDGTKTIVKRSKDEKFDKRLGFLTAYFQKHCGMSKTKANKFLDNLEVEE